MKYVLALVMGFSLHLGLQEAGNISYEHRFAHCVVKMHQNIYPDHHPKGGHYCLQYMNDLTLFEKIALYSPNLHELYREKITGPMLSKAYEESQKASK